jgi:adenine-specific DNA-methyltransferase
MLSKRKHPSLIKYMGSKTKLLDFVIDGINSVGATRTLVDLFSGSASLAGAVGDQVRVVSNDIQSYASVLAETYTNSFVSHSTPSAQYILDQSRQLAVQLARNVNCDCDYLRDFTPATLSQVEREQQSLINHTFEQDWHLFTKNYSGTWWSAEQCIMIDSIRGVAETYRNDPVFPAIISALMFAMAYTSIGTGHYAQFRDPKTLSNVGDILIYRRKKLGPIFERKFNELLAWLPRERSLFAHGSMTNDYLECLAATEHGSTVYADPPYCFVHYSRFYHAIETLVLYDYPDLQIKNGKLVKGRYRETRHQSPFSIRSQVPGAFKNLFSKVHDFDMRLVLSYSNTGMISLDELLDIAQQELPKRKIELVTTDYKHMTLGRQFDRSRSVKECLITVI